MQTNHSVASIRPETHFQLNVIRESEYLYESEYEFEYECVVLYLNLWHAMH